VKRREDGIKTLKMEQVTLQESNSKYAEKVNICYLDLYHITQIHNKEEHNYRTENVI
jgi:hypothetical protein